MSQYVPLLLLAASIVPGSIIFFCPDRFDRTRTALNLTGAFTKVLLVCALIPAAVGGERFEWRSTFVPGVDLVLRVEPFALYFLALSAVLWLCTTVYAIGYLGKSADRSRFFGFFSLCVAATSGIALSGNPLTFVIFYELLTLTTYPLVVHNRTKEAFAGGRTYFAYTLAGGVSLLLGVVWLTAKIGSVDFSDQGSSEIVELADAEPVVATAIFVLIVAGLGVKAALVPLHGWLPKAMVAPAPVSALLHAVAVVKAGVFGIVLFVDYVYGIEVADQLGLLTPLAVLASITIVYGSVQALRQDGIKARLAYSTVSQVSYIVLGVSVASVLATTGAIAHIVNQGLMKITLFFCAGLLAEVLGVTKISQLSGMGRRMPWTCAAFSVGAVGMVGLPPFAGFISKWYLVSGAVDTGQFWVMAILVTSSILNAAYFLPVVYRMWWNEPDSDQWDTDDDTVKTRSEAPLTMLIPTVATAVASVAVGVFAAVPFSPLNLARAITEGIYGL